MDGVTDEDGMKFATNIEVDEDVPLVNLHLLNGCATLFKGSIGDSTWTCIYRLKGGWISEQDFPSLHIFQVQDSSHVTYSQYIACKNPFKIQNTVPLVGHVTSNQYIAC